MDNDFEEFLDRLDKSPPKRGKWVRPGVYTGHINDVIKSLTDVQPMTKPAHMQRIIYSEGPCAYSEGALKQAIKWVEE